MQQAHSIRALNVAHYPSASDHAGVLTPPLRPSDERRRQLARFTQRQTVTCKQCSRSDNHRRC